MFGSDAPGARKDERGAQSLAQTQQQQQQQQQQLQQLQQQQQQDAEDAMNSGGDGGMSMFGGLLDPLFAEHASDPQVAVSADVFKVRVDAGVCGGYVLRVCSAEQRVHCFCLQRRNSTALLIEKWAATIQANRISDFAEQNDGNMQ